MLFVDGESLTIEGQKVAEKNGQSLIECSHYRPDVFLWIPGIRPTASVYDHGHVKVEKSAIRAHYYTSMQGDDPAINQVRTSLRELGFHPEVFCKSKRTQKSKGVDITLAKDMLSHCFHDNYDVAVLIAADGDFVPLVNEVKRMGKVVYLSFFKHCLSPELHLASDYFLDLEKEFLRLWRTNPPFSISASGK